MNIQELRNEIDSIDEAIVGLLNRRAAAAKNIGIIKAKAGLPVFDRSRESEVLRRVRDASEGIFGDSAIEQIFAEIMLESRRLQRSVTWAQAIRFEESK